MSDTKELVLKYLEENNDSFSSGEEIASRLNLSRNSVWKAIESLRRSGYQIEAAPRKGYHILGDTDPIILKQITAHLNPEIHSEFIHIYNSIESTNKTAKGAAAFDAPHGTTIIAETQTLGSGRKKRPFYSPKGGIYMSIILNPARLPFENTNLVTAYAAVSVINAVKKLTGISLGIKWSNDLYYENKKVCGILTESAGDNDTGELSWIVVGIGINFKVNTKSFPSECKDRAGSLLPLNDSSVSKNELIAEILNNILIPKTDLDIISEYRDHSFILGKEITVIEKASLYLATAVAIDDNGKLIVALPSGIEKALSSEEISTMAISAHLEHQIQES